jgi:tRNA-splicing ligase RtcB
MSRVITGDGHVPIHVWGRSIPDGALEQLRRIAAQPYVVEHVAAMPDLHVAHGVAVGTVFATADTVVPAALGGDLGCGMSALRFEGAANRLDRRALAAWVETLSRRVPLGDASHRGKGLAVPEPLRTAPLSTSALERTCARLAPKHLGTLGGGNHFIELDRDAEGDLWLLVHSGSRGLGAAVAAHHVRAAESQGRGDLPGLRIDAPAGRSCLQDLEWALRFARMNREALLGAAAEVLSEWVSQPPDVEGAIDVHHNFARLEQHGGRRLLIHRKGAIAAASGERALIPGSMGTASYVVEGRGEPTSFASASHGAGRTLTRRAARGQIRVERFEHAMRRVVFDVRRRSSLVEEAPMAYRDIGEVLEDEEDLVRPLRRLEPLAVVKG